MTDDWASYLCNVNDRRASIFLNLGLGPEAPIASKPWLLWIWVYFNRPRPDGLSDSNEAPTLYLIEDAINLRVGRDCEAIPCGRITTQGRREFYFYAETTKGFEIAVHAALSGFSDYKFDLGEQDDRQWAQYLNVLYPSRRDLERIKNRKLLDVLVKQGDALTIAREVQHWMYFRSEEARAMFRSQAAIAGFRIGYESQTEGDNPFGITVFRTESIEQEVIDATVMELLRLCEQFGGDYDGWETQVTTQ